MFSSPIFLLGSTLATLWASLFQLLFGRRLVEWLQYWFIGLVGFALGQLLGEWLGLNWLMLGQVHLLEATAICWLAMFVARWLRI